jgi:hypothetical protein
MPGGQPSITQPIAGPWDSPKVVTVKSVPNVLPDMMVNDQLNKAPFYQCIENKYFKKNHCRILNRCAIYGFQVENPIPEKAT